MQVLPRIAVLFALVLLLAPGCGQTSRHSTPPGGLPSGPVRAIGVAAINRTYEPKMLERESHVGHGPAKGALIGGGVGALMGLLIVALAGGTYGGSFALAFSEFGVEAITGMGLVGAAIGVGTAAATAPPDSVTLLRPLSEIEGASELFPGALGGQTLEEALRDRVLKVAAERTTVAVRSVRAEYDATYDHLKQDALDGLIQLHLLDYGFVRLKGEDPRVALRITAYGKTHFISRERVVSGSTRDWVYEGQKRKLSKWMADDGRLFRAELDKAVRWLGDQVINGVFLPVSKRGRQAEDLRPKVWPH